MPTRNALQRGMGPSMTQPALSVAEFAAHVVKRLCGRISVSSLSPQRSSPRLRRRGGPARPKRKAARPGVDRSKQAARGLLRGKDSQAGVSGRVCRRTETGNGVPRAVATFAQAATQWIRHIEREGGSYTYVRNCESVVKRRLTPAGRIRRWQASRAIRWTRYATNC